MEFDIKQILGPEANLQLADPDLLYFYKALEKNHFWLTEQIGFDDPDCAFLIKWLTFKDLEEDMDPVFIHIASPGGDLDTMFCVYDIIKTMKRPVVTINESSAHSAAFLIWLAGSTRVMRRYSYSVAHEGAAALSGSAREMKQAQANYNRGVNDMRDIISSETLITKEILEERFSQDQDWYLYYEDALKYNIIKYEMGLPEEINNELIRKYGPREDINNDIT